MNIIDNLTQDHQKIKRIIEVIRQHLDESISDGIVELMIALDVILNFIHEPKEEEIFLSAISHSTSNETDKLLDGLISEHQSIRDQIKKVVGTGETIALDDSNKEIILGICSQIELHINYEDTELYPVARKYIDDQTSQQLLDKLNTPDRIDAEKNKVDSVIELAQ